MKRNCITRILLLGSYLNIHSSALGQDTTLHAVNDPVMMHYYTKHLFWIVLSLTVVLLLFYKGRRKKRNRFLLLLIVIADCFYPLSK